MYRKKRLNSHNDRKVLRLKEYVIGKFFHKLQKKAQYHDEKVLYFDPLQLLRQEYHLAPSIFNINKRE